MIAETKEYLEDNAEALGIKHVGGSSEFQALVESGAIPAATPAVYVMAAQEIGSENEVANGVEQRIRAGIVIVSVVKNVADPKGAAATIDMIELRKRERARLIGWSPEGCEPLEFDRGAVTAFKNAHLYWTDVYRTAYYERTS